MTIYKKNYFEVSNKEESIRLQNHLRSLGYKWALAGYAGTYYTYPQHITAKLLGGNLVIDWSTATSFYEYEGYTYTELPWLSEEEPVKDYSVGDYSNKYFRVNSEAESRKLQEFLFGLGYTHYNGSKEFTKFSDLYPYLIGTDCFMSGCIGWTEKQCASLYEKEGNEYAELPPGVADEPVQTIEEIKEMIYDDTPVTNEAHIWTDKHYNFIVDVSKQNTIKIDPYFISKVWKLGSKDESGALFHLLKTIARFGTKNPVEREIKALYKQVKRLAELENVNLED